MTLSILSIAADLPSRQISNEELARLNGKGGDLPQLGITSRVTSLPEYYLSSNKNREIAASIPVLEKTPTDLGFFSAMKALSEIQLSADSLGLVVGDTATPIELIPTEAQRITSKLGLKVPSYDITGLSASLPLFLETLSSWKNEKLPKYTLCVSSNAPTANCDYSSSLTAPLFGDGASAMIVSKSEPGILKVLEAKTITTRTLNAKTASCAAPVKVNKFDPITLDLNLLSQTVSETSFNLIKQALSFLEAESFTNNMHIALPWMPPEALIKIEMELGATSQNIYCESKKVGESIGSSSGISLTQNLHKIKKGEKIIVIGCGIGTLAGFAILEKNI